MKYLKFIPISEIAEDKELRDKYNLSLEGLRVEGILQKGFMSGKLKLPKRQKYKDKEEMEKALYNNRMKMYEYLGQQKNITEKELSYFRENYLNTTEVRYHPLSHRNRHIVIQNEERKFVRTINLKNKRNATVVDIGLKGIYFKHQGEDLFFVSTRNMSVTNSIHKCEVLHIETKEKDNGMKTHKYTVRLQGCIVGNVYSCS